MEAPIEIYQLGVQLFGVSIVLLAVLSIFLIKPYRPIYLFMLAIPSIAAVAYLLMANEIGFIAVDGHPVNTVRYADWVVTTPMLLYILGTFLIPDSKTKQGDILRLVINDVLMIIFGFVANLMTSPYLKYGAFAISSVFYFMVINMLLTHMFRSEGTAKTEQGYKIILLMSWALLVLWSLYPAVWIFGIKGNGLIDASSQSGLFLALDLAAKVGYSGLLLWFLRIRGKKDVGD